jgi:hypothetical protein
MNDKYYNRLPRLRRFLSPGPHLCHPGKESFTLAVTGLGEGVSQRKNERIRRIFFVTLTPAAG